MAMLDRKLFRDFVRMWVQILAIALVMACGVATIVTAYGAYRSLDETRAAFYARYRFATVFASVTRAPLALADRITAISGVGGAEFRIVERAILDIDGMSEPGAGEVVSIPDHGEAAVNRLYIRSGRLPEVGREGEVAVLESFARAHRMVPGSRFRAIMNGKKRLLTVTGIVLSPEFIYAIGPGDMVPDQKRYGVLYLPRATLAGIYDMDGAFNNVVVRTLRGTSEAEIIDRLDGLLASYGGTGAYDRPQQLSHSFLDNELIQLQAMASVIPPIFLSVAAFLVNMILKRMVALEREQIGLLKAIGYGRLAIAGHYGKFAVAIAALGVIIGAAAGNWMGRALTRLYSEFFSFPFLIFRESADLYLIGAVVTVIAALAGAWRAIAAVVALPAAVAMQPPAPARYRALVTGERLMVWLFSQLTTMALRNLLRWPVRSLMTIVGTSLSVALLITAFSSVDSVNAMIDTVFFRAERQDVTVVFDHTRSPAAAEEVGRLPGVQRVEAFRSVAVIFRHGHTERRLAIAAARNGDDLSQILSTDGSAVGVPAAGLLVSERVAKVFDLAVGDRAEIIVPELGHRRFEVPVSAVVQSYVGLSVYMEVDALRRLMGDGERMSGARISIDRARLGDFYRAVKAMPAITAVALFDVARRNFRETIERNIGIMTTVYSALAVIITFGVVYNSARIQLSEQAREFASLRVLGFTRSEVSSVILIEILVVTLLAQPAGWVFGRFFAWLMNKGFESDLFRVPLAIETATYAISSIIVMAAAAVSALAVRRRIDRLDLVEIGRASCRERVS
jgi:putative ABC transport system permease protein